MCECKISGRPSTSEQNMHRITEVKRKRHYSYRSPNKHSMELPLEDSKVQASKTGISIITFKDGTVRIVTIPNFAKNFKKGHRFLYSAVKPNSRKFDQRIRNQVPLIYHRSISSLRISTQHQLLRGRMSDMETDMMCQWYSAHLSSVRQS